MRTRNIQTNGMPSKSGMSTHFPQVVTCLNRQIQEVTLKEMSSFCNEKVAAYSYANTRPASWDKSGRDNSDMFALVKATLILGTRSLERRWTNVKKDHCPLCLWKRGNLEFKFCLKSGKLVEWLIGWFYQERTLRPHQEGKRTSGHHWVHGLPLKVSCRKCGWVWTCDLENNDWASTYKLKQLFFHSTNMGHDSFSGSW